jgi:histidyl-tRNA synthetase
VKPLSGIGFACGDMVLLELLKELHKLPDAYSLSNNTARVLVTAYSTKTLGSSLIVADKLRKQNIPTELYPDALSKLDKQLKYADKKGIPYVLLIGPNEEKSNTISLKNLKTKTQEQIGKDEFLSNPKKYLAL